MKKIEHYRWPWLKYWWLRRPFILLSFPFFTAYYTLKAVGAVFAEAVYEWRETW
jgi:hypothetical protein